MSFRGAPVFGGGKIDDLRKMGRKEEITTSWPLRYVVVREREREKKLFLFKFERTLGNFEGQPSFSKPSNLRECLKKILRV